MKLKFYSVKKLKKEILEIIGRHLDLDLYKVFFFGSRVRGDNFPRADIDIGIKGPRTVSFEIITQIKEELENLPTLYKFDIVDFKDVSEKFKKIALEDIEYVN